MRKIIFAFIALLAFTKGNSQILDPVKWTTKIEKISDTNFILTFNGVIENEWHLYSQYTPDGGPLPLEVIFKNQKGNFNLIGKAKESQTRTAYNDIFEVNETFFEKKAQIQQEISIINPKNKTVEVELNYQVCKNACVNQEKKFSFTIPATTAVAPVNTTVVETDKKDSAKVDSLSSNLSATNKKVAKLEKIVPTDSSTESQLGLWVILFIAFLFVLGWYVFQKKKK